MEGVAFSLVVVPEFTVPLLLEAGTEETGLCTDVALEGVAAGCLRFSDEVDVAVVLVAVLPAETGVDLCVSTDVRVA